MLRNVLLASAALAFVATAANAGPQVTVSANKKFVSVMPGKSQGNVFLPPGHYLTTTLARNKEGAYFCCFGNTVSGPSSFLGAAYGVAEQFTLSKGASITKLSAAAGYVSGDHMVTLTLYTDNGSNSPGTALASGTATAAAQFGLCCGVTTVTIPSTTLSAGTPYWIGITAGGNDFNAAPFQVSDEVDNPTYVAGTSNGGQTWGAGAQTTEENIAIGVK